MRHDEQTYLVLLPRPGTLPTRLLHAPIGTLAAWRDDISRALDWLLWGV